MSLSFWDRIFGTERLIFVTRRIMRKAGCSKQEIRDMACMYRKYFRGRK